MKILIYDTETTGLPPIGEKNVTKLNLDKWPNTLQFSYVIYDSDTNNLLKTHDSIIKLPPGVIITEENYSFHHISNKMSETKGKDINVVLREFLTDCAQVDMLVGHNINFDYNMIKSEMMRNPNAYTVEDTKLLANKKMYCTARETYGYCSIPAINRNGEKYFKYPTLKELYEKLFDETPQNLHNSLNDVLITLRCVMKFRFNKDVNNEVKSLIVNLLH
jgi:DNA polymerase III epsilon subunit-like protein